MKLLDTAVLIDIDKGGVDEKVKRLDNEGRHTISIVSVTELYLGVEKEYQEGSDEYGEAVENLERLISRFEVAPINRRVAVTGAKLIADLKERGLPLGDLHDIYMGATALTERLTVLTPNTSHFKRMEGVQVEDWGGF